MGRPRKAQTGCLDHVDIKSHGVELSFIIDPARNKFAIFLKNTNKDEYWDHIGFFDITKGILVPVVKK